MNKIHSFAKVVLAAIGIFFAIRIIANMTTLISLTITMHPDASIITAVIWFPLLGLCLAVICYIFLYKREWLAKWIVGTDAIAEPDSQIQWLPAAFRLVCVAAGMYCLYTVGWDVIYRLIPLIQYYMSKSDTPRLGYKVLYTANILNIEQIIGWLIMLAIGIYLVCGAPHFVRWQVKKTLQQCTASNHQQDAS